MEEENPNRESTFHLDTAGQHLIKDVCPLLHNPDVMRRRVGTLAILNGVNEAVSELFDGSKQVLLYKVHHAVVC